MMRGPTIDVLSAAASFARFVTVNTFAAAAVEPPVVPGGVEAQPSLAPSVSRPMSVGQARGPDPGEQTEGSSAVTTPLVNKTPSAVTANTAARERPMRLASRLVFPRA